MLDLPGVGDKGYASHAFRQFIWDQGARPVIPAKSNEAPVACPAWAYNSRNRVERLWGILAKACEELGGVDWQWQSADCALGKARHGGIKSERTQLTGRRMARSGNEVEKTERL